MRNQSHANIIAELMQKVRNGEFNEEEQQQLAVGSDAHYLGMSFHPSTQILRMFFTPRGNPGKVYAVTLVGYKEQFCLLKTHLDIVYDEIQAGVQRGKQKVLN